MNRTKIKKPQNPKQLITRRRLTIISVIGVTFFSLAAFNMGAYWFIHQIGEFLEQELDARLRSTAQMAIRVIEPNLVDIYNTSAYPYLRRNLDMLRRQNSLEAVYMINVRLNVLVDARPELEMISRGYLTEDSLALKKIEIDEIATSQMHLLEGNYFKNAYAMLYDTYANPVILVMEANARSFNTIQFFKRGMYLGSLISLLVLGLIVFFVTWATRMLVKTEAELQQSQRLAAMGQMAATVAHEIRNPLGIIKSTSDVIKETYQDPEKPNEMFDFITEEIARLNRLVNDFLSFAREPKLTIAQHNISSIVQDAVTSFNAEQFEQVHLTVNMEQDEIISDCDRDTIYRVLLNLLINARQAVKEESADIQINVSRENNRGMTYARISVIDNGEGIQVEPEEIFNPFFTTKTRGTGLGLAVSKTIIEKHGGKITAANNQDKGATITFTLPAH